MRLTNEPNVEPNEPNPEFDLGSLAAFPTQPASDAYPNVLTQGTLVVDDGCLRLQEPPRTDYLLYWCYGDSYRETNEGIQVLDASG